MQYHEIYGKMLKVYVPIKLLRILSRWKRVLKKLKRVGIFESVVYRYRHVYHDSWSTKPLNHFYCKSIGFHNHITEKISHAYSRFIALFNYCCFDDSSISKGISSRLVPKDRKLLKQVIHQGALDKGVHYSQISLVDWNKWSIYIGINFVVDVGYEWDHIKHIGQDQVYYFVSIHLKICENSDFQSV